MSANSVYTQNIASKIRVRITSTVMILIEHVKRYYGNKEASLLEKLLINNALLTDLQLSTTYQSEKECKIFDAIYCSKASIAASMTVYSDYIDEEVRALDNLTYYKYCTLS